MDGGEQLGRCLSLLDSGATEEGEGGGGGGGGGGKVQCNRNIII